MSGLTTARYSNDPDPKVPRLTFTPADDAQYREFDRRYGLSALVREKRTEIERAWALCAWVHSRWKHGNDDPPARLDPVSILEAGAQGRRLSCGMYAITLAGAINASGIRARVLELLVREVETRPQSVSHVVTEAYLPSLAGWIMLDAQDCYYPEDGSRPINAAELRVALDLHPSRLTARGVPPSDLDEWRKISDNYLFYMRMWVQNAPEFVPTQSSIMLVPTVAPFPKVLQGKSSLRDVTYTNSAHAFYQSPE